MNSPTLESLHQAAFAHLQAGRMPEAEAALGQLIQHFPQHAPAHLMLGAIAHKTGRLPLAVEHLNRAIAADPAALDAYFLSGLVHQQQRQLPQAIAAYRRLLSLKPNDGKALNNLGRALLDLGQLADAMQFLRRAVEVAPQNAGAWNNLAEAYRISGDLSAAIVHYHKAIAVDANCGEAHCNLGTVLSVCGQSAQAIASFERAIAINPRSFNARYNLARNLQDSGQLDEAIQQCQLAIEVRPTAADAHNLLGITYGIMGEVPLCIASQKTAVKLQPDHAANHSNLLLSLQYRDDMSAADRFTAHRQWNEQHIERLTPILANDSSNARPREKNKRLRIGYVSPNFNSHSVAYFFEPVLAARDRTVQEVFCYSNSKHADHATARIQASTDQWRDITKLTDQAAAQLIADDRIDILIDLAGHTSGNRLPVFGYRPAPIQMTWIGYPDTTGMTAIDCRLTDAVADPPGAADSWHTEKLLRIHGGCWAYAGPGVSPPPSPPPAIANGFITFGSFNNLPKVTPQVLGIWAEILHQVPTSRLIMKAAGLRGRMGREFVARHLTQFGIAAHRFDLLGWAPSTASHLELYNRIDIALDPFPYNGTTTTCEALWMGVPVITFPGNRHVARVGASLLTHCGFTRWIGSDLQDYKTKAIELAGDVGQLMQIRRILRDVMMSSPLCDAKRVAGQLERFFAELTAPR